MFFSAELSEVSSVLSLVCSSGVEITTTLASLFNASTSSGVKPLELPSLESFSLSPVFSMFIPKRLANPFLFVAVRTIPFTAPVASAAT